MAKKKNVLFKLVSSIGTGTFFIGKKSTRMTLKKLSVIKFDPRINRHVLFHERKLTTGKKK
jgi:large subunit ribosomal protein L33